MLLLFILLFISRYVSHHSVVVRFDSVQGYPSRETEK